MSDRTPAQEGQTLAALQAVMTERQRQHEKWGVQRHDFTVWLTVLSEEVGEVAEQILWLRQTESEPIVVFGRANGDKAGYEKAAAEEREIRDDTILTQLKDVRAEAVQVAAVAVSMIENLDERIEELGK